MTSPTKRHSLLPRPIGKSASVLLLAGGLLYGQGIDLRGATAANPAATAKAAAAQAARTQAGALLPLPQTTGTFVEFDSPGAQGTIPVAINAAGTVLGSDSSGNGFLRASDGTITTFNVPASNNFCGTGPKAINDGGAITGAYFDADCFGHGFLRGVDGSYVTFDAPNSDFGTYPLSIDSEGAITGYALDANFVSHGFVRNAKGVITTLDAPNAGPAGTTATTITQQGVIGGCSDFDFNVFLRAPNGTYTALAPPTPTGSSPSCFTYIFYTFDGQEPALGINPSGAIAGSYFEPIQGNPFGGNYRGYLRAKNGSYQTFDVGSNSPCCDWTFGLAINPTGTIAGFNNDGYGIYHGFVRDPTGNITMFDAPNAGTGNIEGTIPVAIINPAGIVAGLYIDANRKPHGFLWHK